MVEMITSSDASGQEGVVPSVFQYIKELSEVEYRPEDYKNVAGASRYFVRNSLVPFEKARDYYNTIYRDCATEEEFNTVFLRELSKYSISDLVDSAMRGGTLAKHHICNFLIFLRRSFGVLNEMIADTRMFSFKFDVGNIVVALVNRMSVGSLLLGSVDEEYQNFPDDFFRVFGQLFEYCDIYHLGATYRPPLSADSIAYIRNFVKREDLGLVDALLDESRVGLYRTINDEWFQSHSQARIKAQFEAMNSEDTVRKFVEYAQDSGEYAYACELLVGRFAEYGFPRSFFDTFEPRLRSKGDKEVVDTIYMMIDAVTRKYIHKLLYLYETLGIVMYVRVGKQYAETLYVRLHDYPNTVAEHGYSFCFGAGADYNRACARFVELVCGKAEDIEFENGHMIIPFEVFDTEGGIALMYRFIERFGLPSDGVGGGIISAHGSVKGANFGKFSIRDRYLPLSNEKYQYVRQFDKYHEMELQPNAVKFATTLCTLLRGGASVYFNSCSIGKGGEKSYAAKLKKRAKREDVRFVAYTDSTTAFLDDLSVIDGLLVAEIAVGTGEIVEF